MRVTTKLTPSSLKNAKTTVSSYVENYSRGLHG